MGRSLKMHQETCPICPGAVNINHTVTIFRTITHGMIMNPLCNMTNPVIHGMANPKFLAISVAVIRSIPRLCTSGVTLMCICQMDRMTVGLTPTPAAITAMRGGQLLKVPQPVNRQPKFTGPIPVLRHVGGHSWAGQPEKSAGLLEGPSAKVEKVVR